MYYLAHHHQQNYWCHNLYQLYFWYFIIASIFAVVLAAAALYLFIVAEKSILKANVSSLELAVWTIIVLTFPIIGPLTWLLGASKASQYQHSSLG